MKIPLTVRTYSEGLKPFCGVHFSYTPPHGRKIWGTFDAFVDTGSPYTFISKTEALKMNLTSDKGGQQVSIGGAPVLLHPIKILLLRYSVKTRQYAMSGFPSLILLCRLKIIKIVRQSPQNYQV
jgi:hypothetical protein